MAQDITEQAEQEAIADTLVADPEPSEPQEHTETEEPEVTEEAEAAPETEETTEGEEDAEEFLPTEQSKVFPQEVISKYGKRYGYSAEEIEADPRLARALTERMNQDIYVEHLKTLQQQAEEAQQQVEEVAEPEPQPGPTQQPQVTREQYFHTLSQAVQQRTDPQVANDFFASFNKAFGMSDEDIAASLKANPNAPMEFTQTMSMYALNLINTFADDLISSRLGSHIERAFPQFGEMYQNAAVARSWDAVRTELQNPDLPAYGTKEFSSAAREIGAQIAGSPERFEAMIFTDPKTGQQLSPQANLAEKQRMIAERMAAGQQQEQAPAAPPALVAQAVKTGQKIAQRQAAQRAAGNLGSGKSRAQIAGQGNANDDIFGEGLDIYKREHGSL
jgi:hypothetical protein